MDQIKEAFQKVKSDIDFLKEELILLREEISENTKKISQIQEKIEKTSDFQEKYVEMTSTHPSTHRHIIQTHSTHPSTHNNNFKPLNGQNNSISIGNEGVSTDRQTHRQTDRHIENSQFEQKNPIKDAAEILDSLDNIKKEIRLKFKRLTEQEILVFSTIYQLTEEIGYSDYKALSNTLNLTESSIRDYVGRLIKKGIPVEKNRINNKTIHLTISENLRKIASLNTILQLRGL